MGSNRREFLRAQMLRFGLLAVGTGMASALTNGRGGSARASASENPYAYDVERFERTDPKRIGYIELARFKSPCEQPRRMAWGAEGRLYLVGDKRLCVMGPDGAVVSEMGLDDPPQCVAVAGNGTVFIGFRNRVEVYGTDRRRQGTWEPPAGRPFLTGIALGAEDVLVADSGNRVVWRYNRAGKLAGQIGNKDAARRVPGLVLPSPHLDIDSGANGLLYLNNTGRHRIESYTLDGELKGWWGKPSAALDGFCGCCNPISIFLLPDGRLVTCEKGLPRVKVYKPNGELEWVVAGPESFRENARVGAGGATDPAGVGLDAVADWQGRIYVLDRVAGNIRVMAPKRPGPGTIGS